MQRLRSNNDSTTDIQGRFQTSYTALCNGVVSHGFKLGIFRFLPSIYARANASTIFMRCFYTFISTLRPQLIQVTYAPDELWLFWLQTKPEDPQFEPHAEIKMTQVLGSPLCICGLNSIVILYIKTEFANCVPVWGFSKSRIRHEYLLFWFPKFIILCLNS